MTDVVGIASNFSSAISTTAATIVDGSPRRVGLKIQHVGTNSTAHVYIGAASNVGTANGWRLTASAEEQFIGYNGPLWAISNVDATPIRGFETG